MPAPDPSDCRSTAVPSNRDVAEAQEELTTRRTVRSKALRTDAAKLIDHLATEPRIIIVSPSASEIARWREIAACARRLQLPPAGHRLTARVTADKNLLICLQAEASAGTPAVLTPELPDVPLPEPGAELHPAAVAALQLPQRMRVCPNCAPRAAQILSALAFAAIRLGHTAEAAADGSNAVVTLTVVDCRYDVTIVEDFETAPAARAPKYTWQRVTDFDQAPTGRLSLVIVWRTDRAGGRSTWGDRKRWRLEDKLPEVLAEMLRGSAAAQQAKVIAEQAAAERRASWEAAMLDARARFAQAHRAEVLRSQVQAWRLAGDIAAFCDAAEHAAASDPQRAASAAPWLAWARDYAAGLDPTCRPLAMPPDPDPQPSQLQPYLGNLSAYGPESSYRG
ncbi:hypothetical protein [Catenulispora subtropica]|uniref:Uncharacterized protein n=1 Tax=Catenulispora subtropica TaxID=450798 RepID=A0ABP5ESX3_9ACTN